MITSSQSNTSTYVLQMRRLGKDVDLRFYLSTNTTTQTTEKRSDRIALLIEIFL